VENAVLKVRLEYRQFLEHGRAGCSTKVRWQWVPCSRSGMREDVFTKLGSQP